jgi:hypothetical protein
MAGAWQSDVTGDVGKCERRPLPRWTCRTNGSSLEARLSTDADAAHTFWVQSAR